MRKLYREFFYIPKHGKIREKVMLTRVAMTVVIMVVCLAAMSFTAYAYFSHNVTSGSNIIKAANFEADVSITITDSKSNPLTVTKDGKIQTANLDAGEYTVLLTKGASTANTGFCIITINDTDYFTQQIGVDVERDLSDGSASVNFKLKVPSATTIEILSHWGTSKYYGYKDRGRTEIFIDNDATLDLTTSTPGGDAGKSEDTPGESNETITTPSTDTDSSSTQTPENTTTTPAETTTPETTGTSESATTTEPISTEPSKPTSTTEPAATEPIGTTAPETTGTSEPATTTEPISIEPSEPTSTTEPAATEPIGTIAITETQPAEDTTGAPTAEASE